MRLYAHGQEKRNQLLSIQHKSISNLKILVQICSSTSLPYLRNGTIWSFSCLAQTSWAHFLNPLYLHPTRSFFKVHPKSVCSLLPCTQSIQASAVPVPSDWLQECQPLYSFSNCFRIYAHAPTILYFKMCIWRFHSSTQNSAVTSHTDKM